VSFRLRRALSDDEQQIEKGADGVIGRAHRRDGVDGGGNEAVRDPSSSRSNFIVGFPSTRHDTPGAGQSAAASRRAM
jgi:hypothetical protein